MPVLGESGLATNMVLASRTRKEVIVSSPFVLMVHHLAGKELSVRIDGAEQFADAPRTSYATTAPAYGLTPPT